MKLKRVIKSDDTLDKFYMNVSPSIRSKSGSHVLVSVLGVPYDYLLLYLVEHGFEKISNLKYSTSDITIYIDESAIDDIPDYILPPGRYDFLVGSTSYGKMTKFLSEMLNHYRSIGLID